MAKTKRDPTVDPVTITDPEYLQEGEESVDVFGTDEQVEAWKKRRRRRLEDAAEATARAGAS